MNVNWFYKLGSILCIILFYFVSLIGLFAIASHIGYLYFPNSAFTNSLGSFDPIYSYLVLNFEKQPELYEKTSFLQLSFLSELTTILFAAVFLWLMHKFLKTIVQEGLFTYKNVSILTKLGLTIGILGTGFTYTSELLTSKAVDELEITNASVHYSSWFFIDTLIGGILLIIIASALKTAVHAVEENKQTI
ncbi:DUF2975 domain-containing protein [Halobacillus halophilus]|uniref:DUF2975 domain-containing protein n=1 Tax=Halobacillus halophilus TaxID=1570 RepID=UPI001CD6510E|nr:DUF2975 domain-containing protein [Halobacillus halophilus]MCA1010572.1 DUF2975 domain-containing protein [Halobacillus halophilus]